jgi:hypothetical protein
MSNNSEINDNQTLEYWFNFYGFTLQRTIIYLIFIPLNIIGLVLNIISYLVFKNRDFQLPVHKYIRIYTLNSAFICLLLSTRFINTSRRNFSFSNSEGAIKYYIQFYLPFLNSLTLFQAFIDIILSFDRIVLFSNKYLFFKKMNPMLVSVITLILSFILMGYYWIKMSLTKTEIRLSENKIYTLYRSELSHLSNKYANYATNIISDVLPLCIEIPLNIITIKLAKQFVAKKKISISTVTTSSNIKRHTEHSKDKESTQSSRAKRMEIKLTVLVVFMSCLSIM